LVVIVGRGLVHGVHIAGRNGVSANPASPG
jgi:hypothetical protein